MRSARNHALVALCALPLLVAVAFAEEPVESFLPADGSIDVTFVVIEQDPGFDEFNREMAAYIERDREWYQEYAREHQTGRGAQIPWHERFGVSLEEYEHFTQPMNHFREVSRQELECEVQRSGDTIRVEFDGEGLLLPSIVLDLENDTAATPNDVLPYRSFIDLERATLPPGIHRGVHFRTPDEKQRETHVRESLLIGEVRDLDIGIIHFEVWDEEGRSRIYVTFSR